MKEFVDIVKIENLINRLGLPAFDPVAFPITERRIRYISIVDNLANLHDCSIIDYYDYCQYLDSARHAYIYGGL